MNILLNMQNQERVLTNRLGTGKIWLVKWRGASMPFQEKEWMVWMEERYNPDLITLSDEEGKEFTFEVLDAVETEDGQYLAMIPNVEQPEDLLEEETSSLVILKAIEQDGEMYYEEIEDDAEYESVAAIFTDRLQDAFEIQEE